MKIARALTTALALAIGSYSKGCVYTTEAGTGRRIQKFGRD